MRVVGCCVSVLLFAVACGTNVAHGDAESSSSDDSGTEGDDASSGSDDPREYCPNGVVDPGEECDDGNDLDGDGCNRDCFPSAQELWSHDVSGGSLRHLGIHRGEVTVATDVNVGDTYEIHGLDAMGTPRWSFTGTGDRLHDLAVSPTGSVVAYGPAPGGGSWAVGLDTDGSQQWSLARDNDAGRAILATADGGHIAEYSVFPETYLESFDGTAARLWGRPESIARLLGGLDGSFYATNGSGGIGHYRATGERAWELEVLGSRAVHPLTGDLWVLRVLTGFEEELVFDVVTPEATVSQVTVPGWAPEDELIVTEIALDSNGGIVVVSDVSRATAYLVEKYHPQAGHLWSRRIDDDLLDVAVDPETGFIATLTHYELVLIRP